MARAWAKWPGAGEPDLESKGDATTDVDRARSSGGRETRRPSLDRPVLIGLFGLTRAWESGSEAVSGRQGFSIRPLCW
jgi:hypothetical protein